MKEKSVLERVYEPGRLAEAWQQVKANAGAAGVDRMTVEDFKRREGELLELIHRKLESTEYRFKPARRVLIPKEGSEKMRRLGIPTINPYEHKRRLDSCRSAREKGDQGFGKARLFDELLDLRRDSSRGPSKIA